MAYVPQTDQCDLPNSETPMTQARIDAQAARVNRVGSQFVSGNQTMSALVAGLSPPVPIGTCADMATSLSMRNGGRFPLAAHSRGRYALPATRTPGGIVPALSLAAGALILPVPASIPGSSAAGSSAADGPGTPFNNTGWPAGGVNPSGVEYPYGGVQRVLQMIAPTTCPPSSGAGGDLSAEIAGVSAGWWLGLGLAALALLFLGEDKQK